MKRYDVVFNEAEDEGLYAISVVGDPAMESKFITLNAHKPIKLAEVDKKERTLLGVALIPDKDIYRNVDGEEFTIRFSKDVIKKAAHTFMSRGLHRNSTLEHKAELEGMSVVESWIVKDPENDTANAYGLPKEDIVEGAYVVKMKCDNNEIYDKALNGEITGFSIDGLFSLKELQFKKEPMSDKKSLKETFSEVLKELGFGKADVKMGRLKLKDNKTIIEFEGDAPEIGMPVFGLSEDKEERFALPEGDHELENGEVLHVDKNGLVAEAVEEPSEEVKEAVAEMAKIFRAEMKKTEDKFDVKFAELKKDFEDKLKVEEDKNKGLEAKLAKEPAGEKIVKTELIKEPKNGKERLYNAVSAALN